MTPEQLEAALHRRFRVVETTVTVGDRTLSLLHPASAEDLINELDFERDERLPYWADLWPSSRVLGAEVLALGAERRTLLELGCGSGMVATCASLAGFDVTATDYYEDALAFTRVNAWRNGAGEIETRLVDWRVLPPGLGTFDLVVGADVLYERPYASLVARTLAATVAAGGMALIADPGRVAHDEFIRALGHAGMRETARRKIPFVEGQIRQTISVSEIRRLSS